MFGHDDTNAQNDQTPAPDAALTQDAAQAHTPIDDTAGEYIDSAPSLGANTYPPVAPASAPAQPAATDNPDGLLDIKQQALQQLTPLIGHLDQKPSEKFRTTMMMIQASDNQALIKTAYDAAQQITDEKERAQALLDVVNEINYFTQNGASGAAA